MMNFEQPVSFDEKKETGDSTLDQILALSDPGKAAEITARWRDLLPKERSEILEDLLKRAAEPKK